MNLTKLCFTSIINSSITFPIFMPKLYIFITILLGYIFITYTINIVVSYYFHYQKLLSVDVK